MPGRGKNVFLNHKLSFHLAFISFQISSSTSQETHMHIKQILFFLLVLVSRNCYIFTMLAHSYYLYDCLVLFWIFLTTMLQMMSCGNELHTKMMHWLISLEDKLPSVTLHLFLHCRTAWIAVSVSAKLSFYILFCNSPHLSPY